MSNIHKKIHRAQYVAVRSGAKNFELRKEDDFHAYVGDVLVLHEWNEDSQEYTDYDRKVLRRVVTYVLRGGVFGLPPGLVLMSIAKLPRNR